MKYLIDAGSSSFKIYSYSSGRVEQLEKKSYKLSHSYSETEKKLTSDDISEIIELLCYFENKYTLSKYNTKIFATGHFREFSNISKLIFEVYNRTHLNFNVISQSLETFYQDVKFLPYSKHVGNTLAISIGGGSIQISFFSDGKISDTPINLSFGTKKYGDDSENYSFINSINSKDTLFSIIKEVQECLKHHPSLSQKQYPIAFLAGGEITFMKRLKYPLERNDLIDDLDHPYMISIENYYSYNEQLFESFSIDQIISLMPENPLWMRGARPYSAIAQAICMYFGAQTIIPSDCNIIDGVVQQEFRNVVICGSYKKQMTQISKLFSTLNAKGINVISPPNSEVVDDRDGFVIFKGDLEEQHCKYIIEWQQHIPAIKYPDCDAVIICNYDDYIGHYTSGEIFISADYNKKIIFMEKNESEKDFDIPCEVGIIGVNY